MAVSAGDFRLGMRQLAAAVNVITTVHEGKRAGMTATAVVSLTADPPQIGIAVNRTNASYHAMTAAKAFAVNVLSHDQADLAGLFAGAQGIKGEERFTTGTAPWGTLQTGAPVLLDSAASFDCEVVQEVELSSHTLMIGLVRAIRVEPTTTPLLYMDGAWASLVRADKATFDVYADYLDKVGRAMDGVLATRGAPGEQLADFALAFSEVGVTDADLLRDFHAKEPFAPVAQMDVINARKRAVEGKLHSLLVRGNEAGEFDVPDPAITAHAIIGLLNSVHRWGHRAPDAAAIAACLPGLVAAMVQRRPNI